MKINVSQQRVTYTQGFSYSISAGGASDSQENTAPSGNSYKVPDGEELVTETLVANQAAPVAEIWSNPDVSKTKKISLVAVLCLCMQEMPRRMGKTRRCSFRTGVTKGASGERDMNLTSENLEENE